MLLALMLGALLTPKGCWLPLSHEGSAGCVSHS
jgi:hypothetical protein